jgi:hypothetical protein
MLQTGVVDVVDNKFPAAFGLPQHWIWSDEFYVFDNPYQIKINPVLNVDESSYDLTKIWPGQVSHGMGKEHPLSWYHYARKAASSSRPSGTTAICTAIRSTLRI